MTRPTRDRACAKGISYIPIRGHVGRTAVVPKDLEGANITQDTARMAAYDVVPEFVEGLLNHPATAAWMRQRTKAMAVEGINLGDLKKLPVPIHQVIVRLNSLGD